MKKNKKYKILTGIIIVVFILAGNILFFSHKANAQGAYFRLSSEEGNFCQRQIFEIEVRISTALKDTNAAEFYIYYDPSMLEVVDVNPTVSGIQIHEGNVYQSYIDNQTDSSKGEIRLTGFSIGNPYNSGAGSGVFARIPFRGLKLGSTEVSFGFTPGSTTDSNIAESNTSIDILSEVNKGSYTIYADSASPYIQSRRPDKDQKNVPINTTVNFEIKDDCGGADINTLRVNIDNKEYSASLPAHFTYVGTPNSYQVAIRPIDIFPPDYEVKVKINASDFFGNPMEDNYSFFTGHAFEGPYTLLWHPNRFSINNSSNTDISFHIKDNREGVNIDTVQVLINGVSYKKGGENSFEYSGDLFEYTILIKPKDLLSGVVTVVINGCDIAGNCMAPESYWFALEGAIFICPECPLCAPLTDKIPIINKIAEKIRELQKSEITKNLIKKVIEPFLAIGAIASLVPATFFSIPIILSNFPYFFLRFLYFFLTLLGLKKRGKPWGLVFDSQTKSPIKNAIVRIYDVEFNKLKETQLTDNLGRFGFFVPEGEYYIKVIKPGYTFPSRFEATVYHGASIICYQGGKIVRHEKETATMNIYISLDPEIKEIKPSRIFIFKTLHYAQLFLERINYPLIIFGTAFSLFAFLIVPNKFNGFIFILYLVILILKIIITLSSKESFGIVIDKVSSKPVDLAIVRLYKEGQLFQTRITNIKGQFSFLVLPGDYYLTAIKTGYAPYQSEIIKIRKEEGVIRIRIYLEKI